MVTSKAGETYLWSWMNYTKFILRVSKETDYENMLPKLRLSEDITKSHLSIVEREQVRIEFNDHWH